MIFVITHHPAEDYVHPHDGILTEPEHWSWSLAREKDKEPGETIALGVGTFESEREARQAITSAKKAMGGIRFAKTVVVDAPEA